MLTTSVRCSEELSVDSFEDGLLFLGECHDAGKPEATLGITKINFVHATQLQERTLRSELGMAQAVLKQGQEQVGQIADEHVSLDVLGEPMAHGPQLGDTFKTVEGFFDDVLIEVEGEHSVLGQGAGGEDARIAIEL